MDKQYRLKDGVYLVKGASQGAILDTNTGLVYSVNEQACKVCSYVLEDESYWMTLTSLGIAEQGGPAGQQELPKLTADNRLRFVWFEIVTSDCNQRCLHCYAESMPRNIRRSSSANGFSSAVIPPRDRMSYKDWLRAIREAREHGCRACQFIGGEPLLYKGENGETVFDLIAFAKVAGFSSIEIFTNATLLTLAEIQRMKDLGVKVAVSLYSNDSLVHDRITRVPGSYSKTIKALALLAKSGVETRVETILMRANQDTVEATLAFKKEMGYKGRKPDPLRPSGRGENILNQPDEINLIKYGFRLAPNFNASKGMIAHYRSGHSCLLGKIAITEFGEILSCIFTRDRILGNYLNKNSLEGIIKGPELQQIWHMTKEDVNVCQDCEYRYVCFDCRPLAEELSEGRADFKTAPYPRCTYNPYSGRWGDGVWSADVNGRPYYDRSHAPEINLVRQMFEK